MFAASFLDSFAGLSSRQALMFALGLAGLTVLIASTSRRIQRSRRSNTESVRERYDALQKKAAATRDVEHVMIELDQLSREVQGKLDTKIAKLEKLLRDADGRIARLSAETTKPLSRRVDVTLDEESPVELHGSTGNRGEMLGTTGNKDRGSRVIAESSRAAVEIESPHAHLYRLSDEGLSPVEISKKTGRMVGEVELILSLRKAAGAIH